MRATSFDHGPHCTFISRHLQHDRFSAKNNDKSHRVVYATCRISYSYCIRLYTKCRISWVYSQISGRGRSDSIAYPISGYYMLLIWGNSQESWEALFGISSTD